MQHEQSRTFCSTASDTCGPNGRKHPLPADRHASDADAAPNDDGKQSERLPPSPDDCAQEASGASHPQPDNATVEAANSAFLGIQLHSGRNSQELWIRFGRPAFSIRHRTEPVTECYAPGQILGFARSMTKAQGSARSNFNVVQACHASATGSALSDLQSAAVILLSVSGWRRARHVLGLIDALEALGIDPCDLSPDFWREIDRLAPRADSHKSQDPAA